MSSHAFCEALSRAPRAASFPPPFVDTQVFVRCDYNCPLNKDGSVADDFRVRASLPTLTHILKEGPKRLVVATHFGRPKGPEEPGGKNSTLRFVAILSDLLGLPVTFLPKGLETPAEEVGEGAAAGGGGGGGPMVYLMENTRFHPFEEKPAKLPDFKLAFPVDVFVNEAFSASHRDHMSVTHIKAKDMCNGFQLLREVLCLDRILGRAGETVVAVVGGSKMEDKIPMLQTLRDRVDLIAIGGNNVNAITKNPSLLDPVRGSRAQILLLDDGFGNATPDMEPLYAADAATASHPLMDAGPKGLNKLAAWVNKADIVFWNGALGITEHPFYKQGSEALVHLLKQAPGNVVIGGGDTAGFVNDYPVDFFHVSTGGGASIDYLTKESLVGICYYDEQESRRLRSGSVDLKGAPAAVP